MKFGEMTLNVGVTIPESTVQRCIQILNMYLTDNPDLIVKVYENTIQGEKNRFMLFIPKENNND